MEVNKWKSLFWSVSYNILECRSKRQFSGNLPAVFYKFWFESFNFFTVFDYSMFPHISSEEVFLYLLQKLKK